MRKLLNVFFPDEAAPYQERWEKVAAQDVLRTVLTKLARGEEPAALQKPLNGKITPVEEKKSSSGWNILAFFGQKTAPQFDLDLRGMHMQRFVMKGFENITLKNICFDYALWCFTMNNCRVENCSFKHINHDMFGSGDISHTTFVKCNFVGTHFLRLDTRFFEECNFEDCIFSDDWEPWIGPKSPSFKEIYENSTFKNCQFGVKE